MSTSTIFGNHLKLELPIAFVTEQFRNHGVHPSVVNEIVKIYKKHPLANQINSVYWEALEQNLGAPNCALASLIATPFLVSNNPLFDPASTLMWPVLVAMCVDGCPVKVYEHRHKDNIHIHIVAALLLYPLPENTKNKLRCDVFLQWNATHWSDLFDVLNQWSSEPQFRECFDVLIENLHHCAPIDLIEYWVRWGCVAAERANTGTANEISHRFKEEISAYLQENTAAALAPHILKSYDKASCFYKIWLVYLWMGQHNSLIWQDVKMGKMAVHALCSGLGDMRRKAESKDPDTVDDFNNFKKLVDPKSLDMFFDVLSPEILKKNLLEINLKPYSNFCAALECILLLGGNPAPMFPYCDGLNFSNYPLCLAHYQAYRLHNEIDTVNPPSKVEKKI